MFFVISGFYMAMVLRQKYGFSRGGLARFAVNRLLRLYPAYIVAVGATLAWSIACYHMSHGTAPLVPLLRNTDGLPGAVTFPIWFTSFSLAGVDLPAWFTFIPDQGLRLAPQTGDPGTNGILLGNLILIPQAWSIGAEICFYALAPLLAIGRGWRSIVAGLASFAMLSFGSELRYSGYFIWPLWVWIFCMGILANLVWENICRIKPHWLRSMWLTIGVVGLLVTMVLVLPMVGCPIPSRLLPFLTAMAVPFLFSATMNLKWDRYIGNLSYPVYVIHLVAGEQCQFFLGHAGQSFHWLPVLTIVWSVLLAAIIFHFVELPVDNLRQRLAKSGVSLELPRGA